MLAAPYVGGHKGGMAKRHGDFGRGGVSAKKWPLRPGGTQGNRDDVTYMIRKKKNL